MTAVTKGLSNDPRKPKWLDFRAVEATEQLLNDLEEAMPRKIMDVDRVTQPMVEPLTSDVVAKMRQAAVAALDRRAEGTA